MKKKEINYRNNKIQTTERNVTNKRNNRQQDEKLKQEELCPQKQRRRQKNDKYREIVHTYNIVII